MTLALENVHKAYGELTALKTLDLAFPQGKITAVIGPSGCGKSTLLKLLNGLLRPDAGLVRIFDQPMDYDALPALRRRIGYAVQGTGLFPHLSARENISLVAGLEGWSERQTEQRISELLALTHLDASQLDRYPHQLSGGQQQRVGLCRAIMLRPELMLLDEPFAAIDPITRSDIQAQLLELHRAEPVTTVLVTHDMREAMLLADQLVVMGDGELRCNLSKSDLLARYPGSDPEALLHRLLDAAEI